jgi:hypothetical protein
MDTNSTAPAARRILKPTKNPTYRAGVAVTVDYKTGMALTGTVVSWTKTELVMTAHHNDKAVTIPGSAILFVSAL